MKYIKLFEHLNDFLTKSEISEQEFFTSINKIGNFLPLDNQDLKILKDIPNINIRYEDIEIFSEYFDRELLELKATLVDMVDDFYNMIIIKDNDDYYYIEIDDIYLYYKLDQRSEFKKFIKNYL